MLPTLVARTQELNQPPVGEPASTIDYILSSLSRCRFLGAVAHRVQEALRADASDTRIRIIIVREKSRRGRSQYCVTVKIDDCGKGRRSRWNRGPKNASALLKHTIELLVRWSIVVN